MRKRYGGKEGEHSGAEMSIILYPYSCLSTVATSLLADTFNARESLSSIFSVGDFSPRSSWLM